MEQRDIINLIKEACNQGQIPDLGHSNLSHLDLSGLGLANPI